MTAALNYRNAEPKCSGERAERFCCEAVRAYARMIVKCKCEGALRHALVTDLKLVPPATKKRLAPIIGKYLS